MRKLKSIWRNPLRLQIKKQTTIDTCLSVCLMALLKQKGLHVPENDEMDILIEGLKFTRWDYTTGHLVYVAKKYGMGIEEYIEYPLFYKLLSKYKYPKNMKLICKKVDRRFLKRLTEISPVILYVDHFYLDGGVHISHLLILESLDNQESVILDPWFGKRKKVSTDRVIRSIESLRNKLKISPKVIRII